MHNRPEIRLDQRRNYYIWLSLVDFYHSVIEYYHRDNSTGKILIEKDPI